MGRFSFNTFTDFKGSVISYLIHSSTLSWDASGFSIHQWVPDNTAFTPTSLTINSIAGYQGQLICWQFGSDGTNRTITFGTGFDSQGPIQTGTDTNKTWNVFFTSGDDTWVEVGRDQFIPIIKPVLNSVTAFKWTKADGTTVVMDIDTTNGRVGLGGNVAPGYPLDVTGDINTSTDLKIGGTSYLSKTASFTNKTINRPDNTLTNLAIADADVASNAAIAASKISGLYTGLTTQTDQTSNRAFSTVYQNTSGKPMMVAVTVTCAGGQGINAYTDGSNPPTTAVSQGSGNTAPNAVVGLEVFFVVLTGNYYKVICPGSLQTWIEWT